MTKLLETAINKLKNLSELDQNRYANMVLGEVLWQEKFELTKDSLDKLGDSILDEIKNGKFKKIKV